MGTCSYTWKERNKKGGTKKRCLEEIWEGSDEFCIFHDPSPEKDLQLFKEGVEVQMRSETKKHNFIGYCFPAKWDFFEGKEFKIDADFREATFQDANFFGATFQCVADFRGATFQNANFRGATFEDLNFGGAIFRKHADFRGATFEASFSEEIRKLNIMLFSRPWG